MRFFRGLAICFFAFVFLLASYCTLVKGSPHVFTTTTFVGMATAILSLGMVAWLVTRPPDKEEGV